MLDTATSQRICQLLGYTKNILVIRMVREITSFLLKIGRCVEHPEIYKVLQRGYKVWIIYFQKFIKFCKNKKNKTRQSNSIHHKRQFKAIQGKTIQWGDILPVIIVNFKGSHQFLQTSSNNRTNVSIYHIISAKHIQCKYDAQFYFIQNKTNIPPFNYLQFSRNVNISPL